ncbi:hypothetical protein RJ44_11880 [Alteromonas macleodii]|uniref:glycosyltransferase n=1 Tax=Alteromonas macleodii TaxID=28108 RepID=UPI00057FF44C|nr:glycosyltransferase [Alteromonas macleodii]KHT58631.1 hypothetical protein RJ44_11880 [Alteromonas macleodii]
MSLLTKGNLAFKENNYKKAIELYQQAIKENPKLSSLISVNIKLSKLRLENKNSNNSNIPVTIKKDNVSTPKDIESIPVSKQPTIVKQTSDYEGRLEKVIDNQIIGWAVSKGNSSEIFNLEVFVDDVFFCKIKNNVTRGDLKRHKKSDGLGGIKFSIPSELLQKDSNRIEVKWPCGSCFISTFLEKQRPTLYATRITQSISTQVSIIVPIYNAAEDLQTCIERLKCYTPEDVDIILINDGSTDQRIYEILEKAELEKSFRVFHNDINLGFTKTVNRGIELAGRNDVVFLNSDARVTPRWLQGLQRALVSDYKIATVTPMSDRAGAFSAPRIGNENDLPSNVKEEDYALAFRRRSFGFYPTVPTGNGFCMYVRRRCIDEIGALDSDAFPRGYGEENDFCMRARKSGWRNVIDDRTYVFHDRNKSFGEAKTELMAAGRKIVDERYPDYKKSTAVFSESPLISLARYQAGLALKDVTSPILPRGLFVISTLTGGTPQTNRDLMGALSSEIEPWLLHCDSKIISLYKVNPNGNDILIAKHALKEDVDPLTHASVEYDQVVLTWLVNYDFEIVHIRHLAWHSINLPRIAKESGARTFLSFHDYYSICPTVKLLDNNKQFCGGKCTKTNGDCTPELWPKTAFPKLKNNWVNHWRTKFESAVAVCDGFITTHNSGREIILKSLNIDKDKFHVIPHGRNFSTIEQLAAPYVQGEKLRILVPGNISEPKGSKLIEQLLKEDTEGKIEFHVLGRASFDFRHKNLILHGEYKREDFSKRVAEIAPHVGAVFSIWNETWCHTLTELWSVGIAALVTNFPTVASRVDSSGAGWVVPETTPEILKFLYSTNFRESIKDKTSILSTMEISSTNSQMAQKYKELYFSQVSPNCV